MTESVAVLFTVTEGRSSEFHAWLDAVTKGDDCPALVGYRSDDRQTADTVELRSALKKFAVEMEKVLKRNDHKTDWRERPVAALVKLLRLELREFKVAYDHFEVKNARDELVDVANFAMIVYDRLSMLDQDKNVHEQESDRDSRVPGD